MDTTKHFIEFCDHIFAIEDVHCIEKYYSWTGDENNKIWKSALMLNIKDRYFSFPQEKYNEIKQILLEYSKNINNYDTKKV